MTAGLTVTCTNLTSGPGSWSWSFGDGATSTKRNPTAHTYDSAGTYTIRLTGTKAGSSDTAQHEVTVGS